MEASRCIIILTGSLLWTFFGLTCGQYRDVEVCYDNATLCFSTHTDRDVSLKPWLAGDEFCRNRSATLPIITSAHLQYRLGEFLTAFDLTLDNVWLGATGRTNSDNVYHWLDGAALNTDILTGGVSSQRSPSLTTFNESTLLYTADIQQELEYLCQFKGRTDCAGIDVFLDGGICYVVYHERLNWFMARNRCLQRGGDLAQLSNELLKSVTSRIRLPESTYPNSPNGFWIGLRKFWWIWQSGGGEEVLQSPFQKWTSLPNPADFCITTNYRELWGWTLSSCTQRYFVVCQRSTPMLTNKATASADSPVVSLPAWAVGLICGLVSVFYIVSLIAVGCIVYRKCSRKESEKSLYPQMPPPNTLDDTYDTHITCDAAGDDYEEPTMMTKSNKYTPTPYEI